MLITYSDLWKYTSYTAQPQQALAHRSQTLFTAYGSAFGAGKSAALANDCWRYALQYDNATILVCRREKQPLLNTTWTELLKWAPHKYIKSQSKEKIVMKNGATILAMAVGDDERARSRIRGIEAAAIYVDQAEEIDWTSAQLLFSRCRQPGFPPRIFITCNSGPSWVRAEFLLKQRPKTHTFVKALPSDNKFLPEGYIESQREMLSSTLFGIWLNGDWEELTDDQRLFSDMEISEAMNRKNVTRTGDIMWGVDVGRGGDCRTIVSRRWGHFYEFKAELKGDLMVQADHIADLVGNKVDPVSVDGVAVGGGLVDALTRLGVHVNEVFGSRSATSPRYKNLRAQNYFQYKQALTDGARIPDDKALKEQMRTLRYLVVAGRTMIETREDLAKRLQNIDKLDSLVLASINAPKNITYEKMKPTPEHMKSNENVMKEMMEGPQSGPDHYNQIIRSKKDLFDYN